MRRKHKNDTNKGKRGWVSGNPRYSRSKSKRQQDGWRYPPKLRTMGSN